MSIVILIAGLALLALGCFVAGCVIVHRARRQRQAEELRPRDVSINAFCRKEKP